MRNISSAPLTEAAVLAALCDCYHPELRANLVDLGLVHSIAIAADPSAPGSSIPGVPPRYRVHIEILSLATDAADQFVAQLAGIIENRLAAFPTISHTEVCILPGPAWTPDRIAPELRAQIVLALASNHRPHDLVQIQTAPAPPRPER